MKKFKLTGRNLLETVEDMEETMIVDEGNNTLEIYATYDVISELKERDNISEIETLSKY